MNSRSAVILSVVATFLIILYPTVSHAAVPQTMNYQGYLTTATGQPVNGTVSIQFSLYNVASGGAALWTETQSSVQVTNGVYSVILGSVTPLTLPFDVQYYLGVTVGADAEMAPRQALAVVPYAFRAVQVDSVNSSSQIVSTVPTGTAPLSVASTTVVTNLNADMVDSKHATDLVQKAGDTMSGTLNLPSNGLTVGANQLVVSGGNVGIGTATPTAKLQISGGALHMDNFREIGFAHSNGTSNYWQIFTDNAGGSYTVPNGFGIWGGTPAALRLAIATNGNVGVGTGSPGEKLTVAGVVESTSGGIKFPDGSIQTTAVVSMMPSRTQSHNTIATVDSAGNVGEYNTSITIGTDGYPVISYYDSITNVLKVAKCGDAACSSGNTLTTVDSNGNVGWYSSITIGTDGYPVISYWDATNSDLKVAKCGNAACSSGNTLTTVESKSSVGRYTSIAIGTDGYPVISYWDSINNVLRVAKCGNAACASGNTQTSVDSIGNVGEYNSIAIGADGYPVISYYDRTNYDLKVAKCGNAACSSGNTLTAVDSLGMVGEYSSITIGTDGYPVISYYDHTYNRLKVAKCGNATCTSGNTFAIVDNSTGDVGLHTSITIGTDGYPVISYYDGPTNFDLKVAKCGNAACSTGNLLTSLDTAGDVGQYTSITIGMDGNPVISYWDATNNDLKVAKCVNPYCLNNWRRR